MISNIVFPANDRRSEIVLNRINAASVTSSWELQTDTAEIILPRNIVNYDKNKINDIFRVGDEVIISLGANQDINQEFSGYITSPISANIPIKIKCQDEMWKLKQLPVNVSMKATTIPKLLNKICPGYSIDALEVELGTVRFSKTTVSEVLQSLKDDFGLYSYFDNGTLVVGKIYQDNTNEIDIHIEQQVLKNDLEYQNKEDVKVKLRAVSVSSKGEKTEVSIGEDGGTEIQLSYYDVSSEAELRKLAEVDLEKYNQAGFKGSIEVVGNVEVKHGDKVNLTSSIYPERNGKYYIDEVKTIFSDTPKFRKVLKIGRKVA